MGDANPFCSPAPSPRTLWIELTSKCPFDCIFCSRKVRRGAGEHLPFALYQALLSSLRDPRVLVLNYSGESTYYPDLIPAIELAHGTGAWVELVSALSSVPETLLESLALSPLDRLTVSLHAMEEREYSEIYRYSSARQLRARLRRLAEWNARRERPMVLDIGFVAMERNLAQLGAVTEFGESLGMGDILLFPVMRRDEIPLVFPQELAGWAHPTEQFRQRLLDAVEQVKAAHPGMRFTICNPFYTAGETCLGQVPATWPFALSDGARIHSCEQNPWETAHVLSNGDVVACEVMDRVPLGNLHHQTLDEIWHGAAYTDLRRRYGSGLEPACRTCIWKTAYLPAPLEPEILAHRGMSAQLTRGWHPPEQEAHVWSTQRAVAVLAPRAGDDTLHVSGYLPPGLGAEPNVLTVSCNGEEVGAIRNPWEEVMNFGVDFAAPRNGRTWEIEFRTSHKFRPSHRGVGTDHRDLGFAAVLLAAKHCIDRERAQRTAVELQPLRKLIREADRAGAVLQRIAPQPPERPRVWSPGITVLIPERNNLSELAACLAGVERASGIDEPLQILVVASGAAGGDYLELRKAHPAVEWRFISKPLPFVEAVREGLRGARHDWVYLLNNDAVLSREALAELLPLRAPDVFAIASQIFLKDPTRFREETNFAFLQLEGGLATIHDRLPESKEVAPCSYAGGGASLFQRRLLQRFCAASRIYQPFYWEDVEWSWRARKLGYRVLFAPCSTVHHRQRDTVNRFYSHEEVEQILHRNRLLFQLRNFTGGGTDDAAFDELAKAPEPVVRFFSRRATQWSIARARVWNHRATISERDLR
ncbi:MAG: SPASM domain-containing protein [Bryobacterales bacterium]|nr:SPASM domain-containing protein [Bryobacterales bacterium]